MNVILWLYFTAQYVHAFPCFPWCLSLKARWQKSDNIFQAMQMKSMKSNNQAWMSRYQHKRIWELTLPASHNSGTYSDHGGPFNVFSKCQSMNISEQLRTGIRFFDLRAATSTDEEFPAQMVFIAHGERLAGILYDPIHIIFDQIIAFLSQYQSETVVVSLRQEHGQPNNNDLIQKYVMAYHSSFLNDSWINVSIGKFPRGKRLIVLTDLQGMKSTWGAETHLTSIWTNSQSPEQLRSRLSPYFAMSIEHSNTTFRWIKGELTRPLAIVSELAIQANPLIESMISATKPNDGYWFNVVSTDFVEEAIITKIIALNK